jgi:hypothetical protein
MDASEESDRESESSDAFPHYAEVTGEPRPSALKEGTLLPSNEISPSRSGGSAAESPPQPPPPAGPDLATCHRRHHEPSQYLGLHFLMVLGV